MVDDEIVDIGDPPNVDQYQLLFGDVANDLLRLPRVQLENHILSFFLSRLDGSSFDFVIDDLSASKAKQKYTEQRV
jgi:hypothetical protein